MNTLLLELDPAVTATLFAVVMLVSWGLGWRLARPLGKDEDDEGSNKLNDGMMSMLGLLLAFTFSMSLVKHEQRRQAAVTDSNAIGDFYTCASLLAEPVRTELQSVVRRYAKHRLALAKSAPTAEQFEAALDELQSMQGEMQMLVGKAIEGGTPIVVPLVNTLNGVTSSHASRLAALHDRLPPSIMLLLVVAAMLSMAVTGRRHGLSNNWRLGSTLGYTLIISAVVGVTLDLNQPRQGWITVSQESMERLLSSMAPEARPGPAQTGSSGTHSTPPVSPLPPGM